jgi:hypothetical protein
VANIARVVTDQSVKDSLLYARKLPKPSGWGPSATKYPTASIICTKTDQLNVELTGRRLSGPGQSLSKETLQELEANIQKTKKDGDKTNHELWVRKRYFLVMNARNASVTEKLREAYAEPLKGEHLQVFCVSNLEYEKSASEGLDDGIGASCIPQLRQFCHSITAPVQLSESRNVLLPRLGNSVFAMKRWATKASQGQTTELAVIQANRGAVLHDINNYTYHLEEKIDETVSGMRKDVEQNLTTLMENRVGAWEQEAKNQSSKWRQWHWNQYNAWCRNDGCWRSPKLGNVNWTQQIMWRMQQELQFQSDLLLEEISEKFDSFGTLMKKELHNIQNTFESKKTSASLSQSIPAWTNQIDHKIQKAKTRARNDFKTIQYKATESSVTSYVFVAMCSAHRMAARESGPGMKRRQIGIIEERIGNGNLFPVVSQAIQDDLEKLVLQAQADFKKALTDIVVEMKYQVHMQYDDTELARESLQLAKYLQNRLPEFEEELAKIRTDVEDTSDWIGRI